MKKTIVYFPLVIAIMLSVFFYRGLHLNPKKLPSPLLNQAAPNIHLPTLVKTERVFDSKQMKGKYWLLNVWGSWCYACLEEHAFLMNVKDTLPIIGLNYKDDRSKAMSYLQQYGNPYQTVVMDSDGFVGIDWGVYGAPETFLIDNQGRILEKYAGILTKQVWDKQFKGYLQ